MGPVALLALCRVDHCDKDLWQFPVKIDEQLFCCSKCSTLCLCFCHPPPSSPVSVSQQDRRGVSYFLFQVLFFLLNLISSTTLDSSTCLPVYYLLFSISSRPQILLLPGLICLHNFGPPPYSLTGSNSL